MRKLIFPLFFLAWSGAFGAPAPRVEDVDFQNYIENHLFLAKKFALPMGIPISICLAQAMHESRAGQSTLAVEANNHFGIKAADEKKWKGEKFFIKDDDFDKKTGLLKKSAFRKYASVVESFQDYANYLKTTARYKDLFKIPKANYRAWAEGLSKSGYATDSTYAARIIEKIEKYELYKYDDLMVPASSQSVADLELVFSHKPEKATGKAKIYGMPANSFSKKQGAAAQNETSAAQPNQPKIESLNTNSTKKRLAVPPPACPTPPQKMEPKRAKPIFLPIRLKAG